jgi:WD40 repeat protein
MFVIGDDNGNLNQFDVFSESNQSISLNNNAHKSDINTISVFNNYLVSGGDDNILKIWKC